MTQTHPHPDPLASAPPDLVDLVDALVEAIDTDRADAVDRVQSALQPFGASTLFAAEMRLNGRSSEHVWSLLADYDAEVAA